MAASSVVSSDLVTHVVDACIGGALSGVFTYWLARRSKGETTASRTEDRLDSIEARVSFMEGVLSLSRRGK